MVLGDDFEVHLVDAETLTPFKEHFRDGKYYVEVEPNVEYLLSFQRVRIDRTEDFLLLPVVDGKRLGWHHKYVNNPPKEDPNPITEGVWDTNAMHFTQVHPLKFVPIVPSKSIKTKKEETCMIITSSSTTTPVVVVRGKVEFRLYTAHSSRQKYAEVLPERYSFDSNQPDETPPTTSSSQTSNTNTKTMKAVKSMPSATMMIGAKAQKIYTPNRGYYHGRRRQTITLHYCTVPGLIDVGILPEPPRKNTYRHYKTITQKQNVEILPAIVPVQQKCITQIETMNGDKEIPKKKFYDCFDLTTTLDNDDDDDDDDYNDHDDELISQKGKRSCTSITPDNHVSSQHAATGSLAKKIKVMT